MSKIKIEKIKSKNVLLGDNNTITFNQSNGNVDLSKKEREVIDELLKLMKSENEQELFIENINNFKISHNVEEKKSIKARLLTTVSKVIDVANVTDTGFSLYDKFKELF